MAATTRSWYRGLFEECGEYAEEFCWGMTALFALGPTAVLIGLLIASDAIGNPPGAKAKSYDAQVTAWSSTGYAQFTAAWPSTGFDVEVLSGGTDHVPVPLLAFAMTPNVDVAPLPVNNGESAYTETLWYDGTVDLWSAGWPTNDQYFTLDVPGPALPTTIMAYACTNIAFDAAGGPCLAPQPGAPAAPAAAGGRRLLAGPAAGPPGHYVTGPPGQYKATSHPPQAKSPPAPPAATKPCASWYRQIAFPATVTLLANPPKTEGGNWTLNTAATACGTTYDNVRLPITAAVYAADVATMPWPGAPPAWCGTWGTLTAERPNGTLVTIRAASDPFVAAGLLTDCTERFGLSKATYAAWGAKYALVPGLAGCALSAAVLLCLVARRRAAERVSRTRAAVIVENEGTPLAPPGIYLPPKGQDVKRGGGGGGDGGGAGGGGGGAGYGSTAAPGSAGSKGFQRVTSAGTKARAMQ